MIAVSRTSTAPHRVFLLVLASLLLLTSCTQAATTHATTEIAWRNGDVEDAFGEAAQTGKPILLYWGAVWCPPCNRLKATLFHDADFVAQTRAFVPVYLDGDSTGAQHWGEVFAISGYPTLIVLGPDRKEVTRLSGDSDPDAIARTLRAIALSKVSAAELVRRARAAPATLSVADWDILADYGWDVDFGHLSTLEAQANLLRGLAANAPSLELRRRFALAAFASELDHNAAPSTTPIVSETPDAIRVLLTSTLSSADEVKRNRWPLIEHGAALIARVGGTASEQQDLQHTLIAALDRLYNDDSLPIYDRLATIKAEIDLDHQRLGEHRVSPAVLTKVRARAAWAETAATTPYERQSAIDTAADLLNQAGDGAGAERILKAELSRSATPFYYMPDLADLAEARGDKAAALDWLRRGYETSTGDATRVQWATLYALGVIRLTPHASSDVEHSSELAIDELAAHPNTYYQRTRGRLERLATALRAWSPTHNGAAVVQRLSDRMQMVCARTQTGADVRASCASWLAPAARSAHATR